MRRVRLALLLAALVVLPSAAAQAAKTPITASKALWSTVNQCRIADARAVIGVRGSMPPGKAGETLHMRFRVEYFTKRDLKWHAITGRAGATSWRRVGRGREGRRVESGHIFRFKRPAAGQRLTLRGVVRFSWRRDGRERRSASRITRQGHRSARGAVPKTFTASTCDLAGAGGDR